MGARLGLLLNACLLVASIGSRAQQQPPSAEPAAPLIDADHLIVQPEQMATGARIIGGSALRRPQLRG